MIEIILVLWLAIATVSAVWCWSELEDEKEKREDCEEELFLTKQQNYFLHTCINDLKTDNKAHIDILNAEIKDLKGGKR